MRNEHWCVNQFPNQSRTMNHDRNAEDVVPMLSREFDAHFAMPETIRKTHTIGPISTLAKLFACFAPITKARYDSHCESFMPVGGMPRRQRCDDSSNELADEHAGYHNRNPAEGMAKLKGAHI